jgi:hypothetical protein
MSAVEQYAGETNWRREIRVRCKVSGMVRECRILRLTSGRIDIESFVPAITGSRVELQFHLPNGRFIRTIGNVSQHEFTVGFTVDLRNLNEQDFDQLFCFLG